MKRTTLTLTLSTLLGAQTLSAAPPVTEEERLPTISVESTKVSDVSGEEVKSADLAEALEKRLSGISLVRRSGIANDIILRGQKKDNINVLIDDAKIYGACPNRMDPPTSHILTNNIDAIEIIEGPYDVENAGTLSGAVNITTKAPEKGFAGEVNLNFGSWGYRKASTTLSGGGDKVRALVSLSKETSGQYEDGDGHDFAEQLAAVNAPAGNRYKPEYANRDAYDKRSFMGKLYADIAQRQSLMLSYTANRSDDVLYPSSPMDAIYDDSDIFNLEYTLRNLGSYSKNLMLQYYDSKVEHPMSTFYRVASGAGSANEKVSKLETRMRGFKLKNRLDMDASTELKYGVDVSRRNWDGAYQGSGSQRLIDGLVSIDDVDTDNKALFVELEKAFADYNLKAGVRYDDTRIEPAGHLANQPSNDYTAFSGFLFGTYQAAPGVKYFAGVGRAHRVPDARELYFRGSMINMGMAMNPQIGTPTLDQTVNDEIDLGVEQTLDRLMVKTKLFHSRLTDYIYYNAGKTMNRFENIDARIYGLEVSGSYDFSDALYLDFGMAYQRGRKDQALAGQTNRNLAEIPPLKANLALNYDYGQNNSARVELVASDRWDAFDGDNGEQPIAGYGVVNLKLKHRLGRRFEVTAGIDNLFGRTYAISNTYNDLTLITSGATGEVMLLNEPGRYLYLNTSYRF